MLSNYWNWLDFRTFLSPPSSCLIFWLDLIGRVSIVSADLGPGVQAPRLLDTSRRNLSNEQTAPFQQSRPPLLFVQKLQTTTLQAENRSRHRVEIAAVSRIGCSSNISLRYLRNVFCIPWSTKKGLTCSLIGVYYGSKSGVPRYY